MWIASYFEQNSIGRWIFRKTNKKKKKVSQFKTLNDFINASFVPSKTTGPSSEQTGNEKQFNSPTKSPLQTVTPNLNLSPLRKERMHVTETSVNTGNENLQANCPTKFTPETVTRNLFPSPKKSEASLKKTAKEKSSYIWKTSSKWNTVPKCLSNRIFV